MFPLQFKLIILVIIEPQLKPLPPPAANQPSIACRYPQMVPPFQAITRFRKYCNVFLGELYSHTHNRWNQTEWEKQVHNSIHLRNKQTCKWKMLNYGLAKNKIKKEVNILIFIFYGKISSQLASFLSFKTHKKHCKS